MASRSMELRPLAPEAIPCDRAAGWIVVAALAPGTLVPLALGWLLDWFPGWLDWLLAPAWIAFVLGLAWLAQRWPVIEHRHVRWGVDELGMEIRRGVVWRSEVSVPRSRIQHVEVAQGPLQRHHGVATLSLYTAGTEHSEVSLSGLRHATALEARDFLLAGERDDVV